MNNSTDLISIIEEKYDKFSKGQKMIADFIVKHYDKAAFMTASKIGETVDISESTVVRFASALGFSGFPELQEALQVLIKNKLTTVQRIGLDEDINKDLEKFNKRILRNEINGIKNLSENLDSESLDDGAEIISKAKKVFILGLRTSNTLANYLGFYLDVMLDSVVIVNDSGVSSLFEQIFRITEDDVLIAIGFPRYSSKTIEAVKMAKQRGAKIVAITDTSESPLCPYSDVSLFAKNNIVSFVDSLVIPMALINNLILNISSKVQNDIVEYFNELEELWEKHSTYQL